MKMENTDPPLSPTLGRVIGDMISSEVDRTVLVRNPRPDRVAGLMVFCMGNQAIAEIVPILTVAAETQNQKPRHDPVQVYLNEDLASVFTWMQTTGLRYFNVALEATGKPVEVWAFLGDKICRRLAPVLTARGAPVQFKGEGEVWG